MGLYSDHFSCLMVSHLMLLCFTISFKIYMTRGTFKIQYLTLFFGVQILLYNRFLLLDPVNYDQ